MQDTLEKAQAAANKLKQPMYVFRSKNLNGQEISWFGPNEKNNGPTGELYRVVEPQG
ncbi:hypothetical protein [Herbaspirillum rubrisubalbicans]|uniref:hypothetical protein n=1 Tax=Herbaspirillum rubrisubalbicans TaxID=80842 RepID=UPI000B1E893E|nr:hypothetical protein [Herbaspirillum rubrisubalbicans]